MIEMLSSVVNSLTYCVLSHMFFYIFVTFFSNLYILLWQKNYEICRLFGEILLNCCRYFCIRFWGHFLEKSCCLCSVWFPNQQKCAYLCVIFAWFCTVFCETFYVLFLLFLSHVLYIFSSTNHVFLMLFMRKQ